MRATEKQRAQNRIEGHSFTETRKLVEVALSAGVSVLMRGHPGVGKSALAKVVSQSLALPMVDIRLAQRDPAELAGVCFPDRERGVLVQFPPEWVRQACDQPVLVFLDEINAAVTRLHQAAAYQIVLERRVGTFQFHPGTKILAAGNLEEDNAIVSSLSSALCNRFAHLTLRVDAQAWLDWATEAGIHQSIRAYVARHGEEVLYQNDGDVAFPTPRSWEMASRLFVACDEEMRKKGVAACVGTSAAEKFFSYLKIFQQVSPEKILLKGEIPNFAAGKHAEPSFISAALFAVAGWLEARADIPAEAVANLPRLLGAPGVDPEYAFLFLRQIRANEALWGRLKANAEFRQLAGDLMSLRTNLYR